MINEKRTVLLEYFTQIFRGVVNAQYLQNFTPEFQKKFQNSTVYKIVQISHQRRNNIVQIAVQHRIEKMCKHQSMACMASRRLFLLIRSQLATLNFDFAQSMWR
ncbi:Hypothetical_protein [Hexamita inflata]|uniref:Hypothetical_protein n=1 Tax=Hexamita inflata TaxID=28002 RepID=A0AA86UU16_9EUKA|nr:Hypothetical protein HINF_LOCUS59400 [Hexamita inflata]